jgi:GNAT superfamily N-acetyltransferase
VTTGGPATPVAIERGYRPGAIGRVVEMHGRIHARVSGFGLVFESKVAAGLAEFATRLENPRSGLWLAMAGDAVVGAIAIDGEDLGADAAHLRWFVVEDGFRGAGIGRRLLAGAVGFCDARGFAETRLWTFRGLDAARKLYEAHGFVLAR